MGFAYDLFRLSDVEGKLTCNDGNIIGITDIINHSNYNSNHSHNTHPLKLSNFSSNDNGNFVYDLGRHTPISEDSSECDSISSSSSDASYTANVQHSFDCDCNKTFSPPSDAVAILPIDFVQVIPVPDVALLCTTNNLLCHNSRCANTAQFLLSFQHLVDPLDSDTTQTIASNIIGIKSIPPMIGDFLTGQHKVVHMHTWRPLRAEKRGWRVGDSLLELLQVVEFLL